MGSDSNTVSGPGSAPAQSDMGRIREAMEAHEGGGPATEVDTDEAVEKAKKALNEGLANRMNR